MTLLNSRFKRYIAESHLFPSVEDFDLDQKINRSSMRFKDQKLEKDFQNIWKKETKKIAQIILFGLPAVNLILSLAKSRTFLEIFVSLLLTLVSAINYWLFRHSAAVLSGNTFVFLMEIIGLSAIKIYHQISDHSIQTILISLFFLGETSLFAPIFGGLILGIDFRMVVLVEIWIYMALVHTVRELFRFDPDTTLGTKIEMFVSSCVGCIFILIITYNLQKYDRLSFMKNIEMRKNEKSRIEEKLQHQHDIWKAKGRYIAQVAHDIGSPLTTFTLAVEFLKDLATTEEMKDILETAQCAIDLMIVTRQEALDHGKSMEGLTLQPSIKEVCLMEIMRRCSRLMKIQDNEESVNQQEFYINPKLPPKIFSDGDWIWSMLVNYLSNAKKYSNGGKVITTAFRPNEKQTIRIEVADDGIGVPDQHRHHLFKPFGQLMKCAGGTGLGLHGVYCKAKALEGHVGFRTNPNSTTGSIFWFEVPCQQTNDNEQCDKAQRRTSPKGSLLFLGAWPSELVKSVGGDLKRCFEHIDEVETVHEFCNCPTLKSTTYTVVFWMLEETLLDKSNSEVTHSLQEMKDIFTEAWPERRDPVIYISCEMFQQPTKGLKPVSSTASMTSSRMFPPVFEERTLKSLKANSIHSLKESKEVVSPKIKAAASSLFGRSFSYKPKKVCSFHSRNDVFSESSSTKDIEIFRSFSRGDTMPPESRTLACSHTGAFPDEKERKYSDGTSLSLGSSYRPVSSMSIRTAHRLSCSHETRISKLDTVILDSGCGTLLKRPVTPKDIQSLAIRIEEFRVDEMQVPLRIKAHRAEASQSLEECSKEELNIVWSTPPTPVVKTFPFSLEEEEEKTEDILLVDDDQTIRKFISRMLQKDKLSNYKVETGVNGFEGFESLKKKEFQVAIIDLNMPVMDGLECIRRFREWEDEQLDEGYRLVRQPIIMLSANAHHSHQKEAASTGADRFVPKPVKIVELMKVINEIKCNAALQNLATPVMSIQDGIIPS